MSAFNARLKPKELFGMPIVAAVGMAVSAVFIFLSLMLPLAASLITMPIAFLAVAGTITAFWFGDDFQWLGVMIAARLEGACVTSEVDGEEG